MKYIKTYEDHDDLLKSLKDLSGQMSRLKTLVKMDVRHRTPKEIYEDFFLEFKESEKFYFRFHGTNSGIGPLNVDLYKMVDEDIIESEFYRYVNKLKSIKSRLENYMNFDCHFTISLNGKEQNVQVGYDRRNDEFKFSGLGDRKSGYDGDGQYYTNDGGIVGSKNFPDGKVSVIIKFMII